jgi:hypothetical protein
LEDMHLIHGHANDMNHGGEETGNAGIWFSIPIILPISGIEEHNLKNRSFNRLFINLRKSNFHGIHYLGHVKRSLVMTACYVLRLQIEKVSKHEGKLLT